METAISTEPSPEAKLLINEDKENLSEIIKTLSPREAKIIRERHLDYGKTLQELADEFGVTQERVRQLELRAFRKLKRKLKCLN